MLQQQITHQNIFRVLLAGFGLVILLLFGAAFVGIRNIRAIQENAANIVRGQAVTNRLIGELQHQQTSLTEVFSILARDPESVDYEYIMAQLDDADRDINRISAEGAQLRSAIFGRGCNALHWPSRRRRVVCSEMRTRRPTGPSNFFATTVLLFP